MPAAAIARGDGGMIGKKEEERRGDEGFFFDGVVVVVVVAVAANKEAIERGAAVVVAPWSPFLGDFFSTSFFECLEAAAGDDGRRGAIGGNTFPSSFVSFPASPSQRRIAT